MNEMVMWVVGVVFGADGLGMQLGSTTGLETLVQQSLDKLPPLSFSVIQMAACLGGNFTVETIHYLMQV